ncbi:NAD-dependent epimerase/dehydratase family protein [Hymenobacter sp. IS2118]|uniref:NAD-dependent epimerase/dehydratase family protein n=1 Tax=Hymenobacter sp. IS2118 TaxID=1505605 RepID=UPI000555ABF5|nr:NAD-dependent epimerase/dehydratase family protein [Hymenobacter sp. IS2118]
MPPTILVTGANGFLGRHLVAELLRRNYTVRALVRPQNHLAASPLPPLQSLPIECVTGDISQPDSVAGAADGCTAIIHAAALARVNPARDPALWAANDAGTATVLELARQAQIERLVYVGTANVFGFGTQAQPGDETQPFAGARYGLDYMDSKRAATNRVLRAVADWQLPAVLVHPTFMLGPGDAKPTSNALLLELYRGRLLGCPAGGKNYVHVRDVAAATVNALDQGRVGESYILGNQNLSYREAFQLMAHVIACPPPRWPVPAAVARLVGVAGDWQARLTGRPAQVNSAMTAVANDGHYFSVQKAIAELGLPQTPVAQAVAEAFAWFKEHHYV